MKSQHKSAFLSTLGVDKNLILGTYLVTMYKYQMSYKKPFKFANITVEEYVQKCNESTMQAYQGFYNKVKEAWDNSYLQRDKMIRQDNPDLTQIEISIRDNGTHPLFYLAIENFIKKECNEYNLSVECEHDEPDPDGPYGFTRDWVNIKILGKKLKN